MVAKGETMAWTMDLTFWLGEEEAVQWASPSLASIQGVYLRLGCYSTVVEGMEMSGSRPWSKNKRIWPQDELASNSRA